MQALAHRLRRGEEAPHDGLQHGKEEAHRRQGSSRYRRAAAAKVALLLLVSLATGLHLGAAHSRSMQQLQWRRQLSQLAQQMKLVASPDDQGGMGQQQAAQGQQPDMQLLPPGGQYYSGSDRTLSFQVCNGFTNQRIAFLSGMILAIEMNRTMVLPHLLRNGTQATDAQVNLGSAGAVPFGELFDEETFIEEMALHGLRAIGTPPEPSKATAVRLNNYYRDMPVLQSYASHQHLRLDCPAFRVPADLVVKHEDLVFAALDAMQPAGRLMDIVRSVDARLRNLSKSKAYNVLHLRAEEDWVAHCARWERIQDGVVRDNCINNTETVGDQLRLHRVDPEVPLFVATSWAQANEDLVQAAVENLEANNYKVVLRDNLLGKGKKLPTLAREEAALIDYYLALNSEQFVGNSVSTFSAMLIMERWRVGRYATYYNGGNIPLEIFMPLYRMPWVFTFNDWSSGTEYEHMVKAAVTSAIEVARMKPFCMYSGSKSSSMYQWLRNKDVSMIHHEPEWREAFAKEVDRNREHNAKMHSHLYKTDGSMVGTFQRIDIPILSEFDQYNYVLFTDCDVYFRKHMKLTDWGTPLPTAIGMGYEMDDIFPYNAGIMLMNMPYLRETNKQFVDWILAQRNGLYFDGYGPLDQGAINQFYEANLRGHPISKDFNAKPYQEFRPQARIVHMHGPKPNHYLQWLLNGSCEFGDMCKQGFSAAFCKYAYEYAQFAPEWEVATTLKKLCSNGQGLVEARVQQANGKQQAVATQRMQTSKRGKKTSRQRSSSISSA